MAGQGPCLCRSLSPWGDYSLSVHIPTGLVDDHGLQEGDDLPARYDDDQGVLYVELASDVDEDDLPRGWWLVTLRRRGSNSLVLTIDSGIRTKLGLSEEDTVDLYPREDGLELALA